MIDWLGLTLPILIVIVSTVSVNLLLRRFGKMHKLAGMVVKELYYIVNVCICFYVLHLIFLDIISNDVFEKKIILSRTPEQIKALSVVVFELLIWGVFYFTVLRMFSTLEKYLKEAHNEIILAYKGPIQVIKITISFVFIMILLFMVFQFHGYQHISSLFLSSGALGSVLLALSFKQASSNILGGVQILINGSMKKGEYITLKKNGVSGTVTKVGWDHTEIKTVDGTVITLNNSVLLTDTIENSSKRKHWRISQKYGLRHEDRSVLNAIMDEIKNTLSKNKKVQKSGVTVILANTNEYAIFFNVNVYLNMIPFSEKSQFQNEMIIIIMDIIHKYGAKIALPLKLSGKISNHNDDNQSDQLKKAKKKKQGKG